MSFNELYNEIKDKIIDIRRKIHQYPELGFEEYKTSDTICAFLDEYDISYKSEIACTGILATIGQGTDKVLLIRADMDALPIEENTNLPFTSKNHGVMHACGHDVHIASALAAAVLLKRNESILSGTVKIMFQPAEESTGGALPMIEEGILENPKVTCAIGGHVDPAIPVGQIKIKEGALMASPDDFEIVFTGKSAHAAQPQDGISPIIPAAKMVSVIDRLQKEVFVHNVLSVCTVESLGGKNIIPDKATILGSFRSFDEESRVKADNLLRENAETIAKEHGVKCDFKYNYLYPPLINDPWVTNEVIDVAMEYISKENITLFDKPLMTGEDFSYICKHVPAAFFWYGGGNEYTCAPLHSSEFKIDEDAIRICSGLFYEFAMKYLR